MKYRLPRKKKKEMKSKYQGIDANFNITGSLYDSFTWRYNGRVNNKYYGKIKNWRALANER